MAAAIVSSLVVAIIEPYIGFLFLFLALGLFCFLALKVWSLIRKRRRFF